MFHKFYDQKILHDGLVTLSMKDSKSITDYGLSLVLRKSPNLKHLDLTGCVNIGDVCMRELGMHCHQLQTLILTSCHAINGEGLIAVGDMCRNLRKLSLSRCKNVEK